MSKKILIIDDEELISITLTEMLKDAGYSVFSCNTAEKAITLIKRKHFDLLLVDVMLPGMNGITLVQIAEEIRPELECIIMSGFGSYNTMAKLNQLGVFGFLEKPVRMGNLLGIVDSAIKSNRVYRLGYSKQEPRLSFNRERVLLVDDEKVIQTLISEILTGEGYRVTIAENGRSAYEKILINDYDLIIMDINMPKMDGVDAVRAIRERDKLTYILLISGRADTDEINAAISYGANKFLQKPFTVGDLKKIIKDIDFIAIDKMKKEGIATAKQSILENNSLLKRFLFWIKKKF